MRWSHLQRCALAAAILVAAAAAPSGAAEPPAVVTVTAPAATTTVPAADLGHWVRVARASQGGSSVSQRDAERAALQALLGFTWTDGEAVEQGIAVSDAEVRQSFDAQRRQSFPKLADFRRFLRQTRQTVADVRRRVRLNLLSTLIRDRIEARAASTVTAADVDARVQSAGPQIAPEERDIRLAETHTRAGALRVRARLRRHEIDPGEERGFLDEDHGPAVAKAVFRAPRGRVVGPLRGGGDRYFVFEVVRIHPRHVMSLAEARALFRPVLIDEAKQNALDAFLTAFTAKWRSRTTCAPAYVWDSDCGNWDGTPPGPS